MENRPTWWLFFRKSWNLVPDSKFKVSTFFSRKLHSRVDFQISYFREKKISGQIVCVFECRNINLNVLRNFLSFSLQFWYLHRSIVETSRESFFIFTKFDPWTEKWGNFILGFKHKRLLPCFLSYWDHISDIGVFFKLLKRRGLVQEAGEGVQRAKAIIISFFNINILSVISHGFK